MQSLRFASSDSNTITAAVTSDKNFAIASQVAPEALHELRDAGVTTIICHSPDEEGENQPAFSVAARAEQCGMVAHFLLVVPGKITVSDIEAFAALIAALPKPVLAY